MESSRSKTLVVSIAIMLIAVWSIYMTANDQPLSDELFKPAPSAGSLEDGDIILRRADGLISDIARNFSRSEKRFSHVGIIAHIGARMSVIHSIEDPEKGFNGVVSEDVQGFLQNAQDWAIYRLQVPAKIRRSIASNALAYMNSSISFDNNFDLESKNAMYCSELLYHVINGAAGRLLIQPHSTLLGKDYVSIEDTYRNPVTFLVQ